MKKPIVILSLFALFVFGCQSARNFTQQKASSKKGMVSAAHPLAVKAGSKMLALGGNAADAAIASAFALAVVEPSMSGLGGRQQIILRLPNGEIHGIDASSQSPMNYDTTVVKPKRHGYTTIGIPGVVAGLCRLHQMYGSLSLPVLMEPAISYAEDGFELLAGEAKRHALVAAQLADSEGARQYFMDANGKTFPAGHHLVQEDLAAVLKAIALGGKDAFYKGEIAQKIADDMQKNGGLVNLQDLAKYEAKEAQLVSGNYRAYDLHGLWLPSFGAITIEILHILENWPMSDLAEAERVSVINEAIQAAYSDRSKQYEEGNMAKRLCSKEYAKEVAQKIKAKGISMEIGKDIPSSWTAAIGHTTHLSTADANGMMVALTQSNGPLMGSKVASPGLGFMYAVSLGEYLGIFSPNQRVSSHISPMLVTKDGEPFLALGAAGGARIIPAVVQLIHRVIDQDMAIDHALAAARIYPNRDTLELENHKGIQWKKAVIDQLERNAYPLKFIDRKGRFARVHAVRYHAKKKKWVGGADPDWEGSASPPKK